jgi:phosphatidate cytidylyltransferase
MDEDRLKTGVLLILVVVLVAWIDSLFLTWLVLGITYMFAFYEAMKLYKVEDNSMYVYATILWLLSIIYQNPDDLIFVAFIVAISYMLYKRKLEKEKLLPLLYPTASFLFLFSLYKGFGMETLIWLTIVVALTDTGAYFSGKWFGKRQFNPISPKKTWEGVIGGVTIATIFATWYGASFVSVSLSFFISLLVSISSIYGDLYESFLKRRAGVKDSGNILPGHGGILDRVDGFMFASVMMVVLLRGLA